MRLIDAHIHLDLYPPAEREQILQDCARPGSRVDALIAVSMHAESCLLNRELALRLPRLVKPCYGFHPEQPLPGEAALAGLRAWIRAHADGMAAIGEVGLPYYTRAEAQARGERFDMEPYVEALDGFIQLAVELDKPVVLHAVYEDAAAACDLLERRGCTRAHFHWFKGPREVTERMVANGYFVSFTPDLVYETEIQELARLYPPAQVMLETDGPWPFEGPFTGRSTHPEMMMDSLTTWSMLHGISREEAGRMMLDNTRQFYRLGRSEDEHGNS
ncbi:DNAase [Paenibacillus swuensis]|uniref:DNAase n=1 Tax=Paenibacillus swuensis TaxID=1178515 RepID=A0A172TN92_9BACL|nr:TatD family hydrolase [Paenibacillus swuensis]ANE48508.1 DNAase [Paenibacillus swuensis]